MYLDFNILDYGLPEDLKHQLGRIKRLVLLKVYDCENIWYSGLFSKKHMWKIGDTVIVNLKEEKILSELFLAEKKRHVEQWMRISKILKSNRKRFENKTDVIAVALDLLETELCIDGK